MASRGEDDGSSEREVVATLVEQLGVEEAVVRRIFGAGVDHADRSHKRRRLTGAQGARRGGGAGGTADDAADGAAHAANGGDAGEAGGPGCQGLAANAAGAEFAFSACATLEELRRELADFAVERDWDQYHAPRNLALALVGEVGELCEIFQWKGEVPEGLPGFSQKQRLHVAQELADVLLYLVRLSHKCHVDLPRAALDKITLNAAKYPAALVRGSSKKYSEYGAGAGPARAEESPPI